MPVTLVIQICCLGFFLFTGDQRAGFHYDRAREASCYSPTVKIPPMVPLEDVGDLEGKYNIGNVQQQVAVTSLPLPS